MRTHRMRRIPALGPAVSEVGRMAARRLGRASLPIPLSEQRDRTTVIWAVLVLRTESGRTFPTGAQRRLRLVHHLLQERHFDERTISVAIEEHQRKAEEQECGLHDSHTLLPDQLVGHECEARAESEHLALILLALALELDDCALPELIVGLSEAL